MNNDKLLESVGKLTNVFFELWGGEGYDQEEYNQVFDRLRDEVVALFPAPEPVDDNALAEAIDSLTATYPDPAYEDARGIEISISRGREIADLIRQQAAMVAELQKYKKRLIWLHTGGGKDLEGFEWGVYRAKCDQHGKFVECWHTNSDFSDLDAEMEREARAAGEGKGAT